MKRSSYDSLKICVYGRTVLVSLPIADIGHLYIVSALGPEVY